MGSETIPKPMEVATQAKRCLHALVFDQAARTPERTAVRACDGTLSYGALASQARSLARRLRSSGVGDETPVGVFMPRTCAQPVAMLGILAAGGAYVPLDPSHPEARTAFMLADTEAPVVVTTAALAPRLASIGIRTVAMDDGAVWSDAPLEEFSAPERLAYLIYTSGSTGRPKGVMIEHRNVAALIAWAHGEYSEAELSRVVAATSITFDLSVFEIFAPLSCGGSIDLIEDGLAFAYWPDRGLATLLNTVPSIMRELLALNALPPTLRVINLAGEPLATDIVEAIRRCCPGCRIHNLYGPSEDTTYSTGDVVLPGDARPTIGRPLAGRHLYLLDEDGNPVKEGEIGEIHVGGPGVARGYWRRPDLTVRAFLPDPASPSSAAMYRTGDYGRIQPDGRLLFLGRRDDQIKLRGYRIDLGEIDAVVRSHVGVIDVATVTVEDQHRGTFLRCALTLRPGTPPDAVETWLRKSLPAYMVPADWLPLAEIPKLSNGKVDRKALRAHAPLPRGSSEPPEGDVEIRLAMLWSDLLGVTTIGRDDAFLALGGHSLLAARLSVRIQESFGLRVSGPLLLRCPTVRMQAELLRSAGAEKRTGVPTFTPAGGPAPCSPAQLRMWTLEQLLPGCPQYNIPVAFRLRGPLDVAALAAALRRVVQRHEILRTVYEERGGDGGGGLRQRVLPPPGDLLAVTDLSDRDPGAAAGEALRLATAFARRGFDLARQPPLAAMLVDLGRDERILVLSTHHIAVDGSVELLVKALSHAFDDADAPPAAPSYIDFCAWHGTVVERTESVRNALAYWTARLADPPPLNLPADCPPPGETTGRGLRHTCAVPRAIQERLVQLGRERGVTVFQGLLALTWAFLARLCDQDDICLAVPLEDRPHPALRDTIGNFVNTVILRGALKGEQAFESVLEQARDRTIEAIEHGGCPFDRVVEAIPASRRAGAMPFTNVMLSLRPPPARLTIPGIESEPVELELATTRFDLGFFFLPDDTGALELSIEYDAERFEPGTVRRYAGHWFRLAEAALTEPTLPLSRLPLLSAVERADILERWNATARDYDATRPIHALFEERAQRAPNATAVVGAGLTLNYGELNARADGLASALSAHGVASGSRVAILCDRSPHLIVAMVAVLKAGCAYVPLDPDTPPARHATMLRISGAGALITDTALRAEAEALRAGTEGIPCLVVDDLEPVAAVPPPASVPADGLAYVIFTSGTTGVPKAVMVRHRPVVNLIEWVNRTHSVGAADRLLFVTSVAFDLSVYDVFGILAAGASIRIASRAEVRDPRALAEIIDREPVTFWDSAPIALEQCVACLSSVNSALRLVFLSGDWIPVTLPGRLRDRVPDVRIVALGGATEAVVWSNYHEIETVRPGQSSIPYGRPIQNARYHILDRHLEPMPVGVPGDLFIGGEVLADGYMGDAEQTAARFLPDPFRGQPGARIYRTGDRARYWEDGTIEFLGRLDNQAKIRGFRVETGEVEAVLAACEGVRAAHVAIRGDRGDRWLCAYVVLERREPGVVVRLRAALRQRLPEFMVPAAIVVLDVFPRTANGKLDRARLPEPRLEADATGGLVEPRNAVEAAVTEIWRNVLGIERVGIDDNFFDVGGNSIRLVEVLRALENRFGRRLPIVAAFRYATIRALSDWITAPAPDDAAKPPDAGARLLAGRRRMMAQQRRVPVPLLTEADGT